VKVADKGKNTDFCITKNRRSQRVKKTYNGRRNLVLRACVEGQFENLQKEGQFF